MILVTSADFSTVFNFFVVTGFYNGELEHSDRCYFFSKPCIRMMLVNGLSAENAENRIKLLEFYFLEDIFPLLFQCLNITLHITP